MYSVQGSSRRVVPPTNNINGGLPEDVVVISIYDPRAAHENWDTPYMISPILNSQTSATRHRIVIGSNISLRRTDNRVEFNFGRKPKSRNPRMKDFVADVYLPGSSIAQRQFSVHPDWKADCWYLQSRSENITVVDGVSLQVSTPRTRKVKKRLPEYIYLSPSSENHITVGDLQMTVRILKDVRGVYSQADCADPPIRESLAAQLISVSEGSFVLSNQRISARSRWVTHRLSGEVFAAKLFEGENVEHIRRLRDNEFRAFHKD